MPFYAKSCVIAEPVICKFIHLHSSALLLFICIHLLYSTTAYSFLQSSAPHFFLFHSVKGLPGGREADYIKVIQLFQFFVFMLFF